MQDRWVASSVAGRLLALLAVVPAERPTAGLAGLDPAGFVSRCPDRSAGPAGGATTLAQAAQVRVLAAIDTADDSALPLSQEAVSLVLRIPVRTAQTLLRPPAP